MSFKEDLIKKTEAKITGMTKDDALHCLDSVMYDVDTMYNLLKKLGFKDEDQDFMMRQVSDFIDWCDQEYWNIRNTVYVSINDERK